MSISNRSVNRTASTSELEGTRADYISMLSGAEDDMAEWLESGIEIIDDELADRKKKG